MVHAIVPLRGWTLVYCSPSSLSSVFFRFTAVCPIYSRTTQGMEICVLVTLLTLLRLFPPYCCVSFFSHTTQGMEICALVTLLTLLRLFPPHR